MKTRKQWLSSETLIGDTVLLEAPGPGVGCEFSIPCASFSLERLRELREAISDAVGQSVNPGHWGIRQLLFEAAVEIERLSDTGHPIAKRLRYEAAR